MDQNQPVPVPEGGLSLRKLEEVRNEKKEKKWRERKNEIKKM